MIILGAGGSGLNVGGEQETNEAWPNYFGACFVAQMQVSFPHMGVSYHLE